MVSLLVLVFSSCLINVSTTKGTSFERRPISLIENPNYSILGPVVLEQNWRGIVGITLPQFSIPFSDAIVGGNKLYLFQVGGITYADILARAQELYPEADAVIDIQVDFSRNAYAVFYAQRTNIMTGMAIRFSREEVTSADFINSGDSSDFSNFNDREVSGSINLTF
jgi:hypothetical protein